MIKRSISIVIGIILASISMALIPIYLFDIVEPIYSGIVISGIIIATAWWTHTRWVSEDQSE